MILRKSASENAEQFVVSSPVNPSVFQVGDQDA